MSDVTCWADDCPRTTIVSRGLCGKHYWKLRQHGDPNVGRNQVAPGVPLAYFYATYLTPAAHDPGWPYALTDGYGRIVLDGRATVVSVLSCTLAHGPKPSPEMQAAHGCPGNTKCFWTEHLSWKTPKDNTADRLRDGTMLFEERCNLTTIPAEIVIAIRDRYAGGETNQSELGREFGISQKHVGNIVHYRSRNHLPAPDRPQAPPR